MPQPPSRQRDHSSTTSGSHSPGHLLRGAAGVRGNAKQVLSNKEGNRLLRPIRPTETSVPWSKGDLQAFSGQARDRSLPPPDGGKLAFPSAGNLGWSHGE